MNRIGVLDIFGDAWVALVRFDSGQVRQEFDAATRSNSAETASKSARKLLLMIFSNSKPNLLIDSDTQLKDAASRRVLRAGHRQR